MKNLNEDLSRIKQMMGLGNRDSIDNYEDFDRDEENRFTCTDCGNPDYNMYMVNDDIWKEYGNEKNTLCKSCLEKRMDRELTADDFSQHKNALTNIHNPEVQSLF